MMDLAASHDCNGQSYKRKRNSTQEVAIDGRLENTTVSEVADSLPKRKRMRLWEGPKANPTVVLSVNSDSRIASASKKESKKLNGKSDLPNSRVQPVKETRVGKDAGVLAKHVVKSRTTKARRASPKLTVRMKFMPTSSKKLQPDTVRNQSTSHSQISDKDNTDTLTSNGEVSPTLSACKLVSKQSRPRDKKQQSSEHFSAIRRQTSPTKSPASNRLILPRHNVIVNADESSTDLQWIPPQSPFNLAEESMFHSSWKILVASVILENGQGRLV